MAGNPIAENPLIAADGMANLAHAIRRSAALYVAMQITPPESTVTDLLNQADVLATWINGKAGAAAAPPQSAPDAPPAVDPNEGFLGQNPWA